MHVYIHIVRSPHRPIYDSGEPSTSFVSLISVDHSENHGGFVLNKSTKYFKKLIAPLIDRFLPLVIGIPEEAWERKKKKSISPYYLLFMFVVSVVAHDTRGRIRVTFPRVTTIRKEDERSRYLRM